MSANQNNKLTLSSKTLIPIPVAAPAPAKPMKCPLPMLLANKDAPTYLNAEVASYYTSNCVTTETTNINDEYTLFVFEDFLTF